MSGNARLPCFHHPDQVQRGFTLTELIVAVLIVSALAIAAAPSMVEMIAKRRVQAAADELATDLRLVRSIVVGNNRQAQFRLYFEGAAACYIISDVSEDTDDCDCLSGRSPVCVNGLREHKTVRFPASGSVKLERVSGHRTVLIESMQGRSLNNRKIDTRIHSEFGGAIRVKTNETFAPVICSETGHSGYVKCETAP